MINIAEFGVKFDIGSVNTIHTFASPVFRILNYLLFAPVTLREKIGPSDL